MKTVDRYRYALGVDPGTTTGLSVVCFHLQQDGRPTVSWSTQAPWNDACKEVEYAMYNLRERKVQFAVTVEKFTINAQTAQRGQRGAEDALGMAGVVRRECLRNKSDFTNSVSASAAKTLVSDDLLRRLSLFSPGLKHANDATRHAVHVGITRGWLHRRWLVVGL